MSRCRTIVRFVVFAACLLALVAGWWIARDPDNGANTVGSEVDTPGEPLHATNSAEAAQSAVADTGSALRPAENVVAMRTLALAGDGQAAWWMVEAFEQCRSRELQDDDHIRTANQRLFEENLARMEQFSRQPTEADIQRSQRAFDDLLAQQLEFMAVLRQRCPQLTVDDEARLMDWLDLALASGQRELLARLNIFGGVPMSGNQPWLIRNAERMAKFIERAREAYEARVLNGDRQLLQRASVFYENRDIWPEVDHYQAYVHALATVELGRVEPLDWPVSEHALRQLERHLDDHQREQARQAASELFQRCCAGPGGQP